MNTLTSQVSIGMFDISRKLYRDQGNDIVDIPRRVVFQCLRDREKRCRWLVVDSAQSEPPAANASPNFAADNHSRSIRQGPNHSLGGHWNTRERVAGLRGMTSASSLQCKTMRCERTTADVRGGPEKQVGVSWENYEKHQAGESHAG